MMFWKSKPLQSEEYLKLFKMVEELRIRMESLQIDLSLAKKKLKIRAGIEKEDNGSMEEETKSINNPVILPFNGNFK